MQLIQVCILVTYRECELRSLWATSWSLELWRLL